MGQLEELSDICIYIPILHPEFLAQILCMRYNNIIFTYFHFLLVMQNRLLQAIILAAGVFVHVLIASAITVASPRLNKTPYIPYFYSHQWRLGTRALKWPPETDTNRVGSSVLCVSSSGVCIARRRPMPFNICLIRGETGHVFVCIGYRAVDLTPWWMVSAF
jgi:hypothetical protein